MNAKLWVAASILLLASLSPSEAAEYLVKLKRGATALDLETNFRGTIEAVSEEGRLFKLATAETSAMAALRSNPAIEAIQLNHPIHLIANPSLEAAREAARALREEGFPFPGLESGPTEDNPEIKQAATQATGADPMLSQAWGLSMVGGVQAWQTTPAGRGIIVAVTDTGVDYNHVDLINNMWRNPGEIPGDGADNDNNGFVDDVVGWDFAYNDNKPYDHTLSLIEILFQGGNPGHGTHCAGVVGARRNNAKGAAGIAPEATIMALRFITEKGQGDTASAVKVVDYAVKMGARIISASWGSEGEEEGDFALREAIQRAQAAGVLFVAAAGNGRVNMAAGTSAGFDNDTDAKPVYPASYPYDNVIAVAALQQDGSLAGFSNWGSKGGVDLGAPGVKILSTVPGDRFQDTVIDLGEFMKATWDGTSMATPFVAGGAAVAWSRSPQKDWRAIKDEVLRGTVAVPALSGKLLTGGRLDMKFVSGR